MFKLIIGDGKGPNYYAGWCVQNYVWKNTRRYIQIFTLLRFVTESDLLCYIFSICICMYNKTLKFLLDDYKK